MPPLYIYRRSQGLLKKEDAREKKKKEATRAESGTVWIRAEAVADESTYSAFCTWPARTWCFSSIFLAADRPVIIKPT